MNSSLLASWGTIVFGALTMILILVALATGRREDRRFRVAMGVSVLLTMLCFAYNRFL